MKNILRENVLAGTGVRPSPPATMPGARPERPRTTATPGSAAAPTTSPPASGWATPTAPSPMATDYNGGPVDGGTYPAIIWGQIMGCDRVDLQPAQGRGSETRSDSGDSTTTDSSSSSTPYPSELLELLFLVLRRRWRRRRRHRGRQAVRPQLPAPPRRVVAATGGTDGRRHWRHRPLGTLLSRSRALLRTRVVHEIGVSERRTPAGAALPAAPPGDALSSGLLRPRPATAARHEVGFRWRSSARRRLGRLGDADPRPGHHVDGGPLARPARRARTAAWNRSAPFSERSIPSASASLPGPEQRASIRSWPRRSRIRSMPSVGSSARISTADAVPSGSVTAVQQAVDPVGEVDVRVPRRSEEDLVAGGPPDVGVTGRIAGAHRPRSRRSRQPSGRLPAGSRSGRARPRAPSDRRTRRFTGAGRESLARPHELFRDTG